MTADEKAKLGVYSQWASERLKAGQDPRDVLAFLKHLKKLGADYRQPELYGLPFVLVRVQDP